MKKDSIAFLSFFTCLCLMVFASCGGGGGGGGAGNATDDTAFSIGYNANGAESGTAPSAQTGNGKEVLSVSDNTGSLAKAGYLFDGWNTSADGSGADYAPGALYNGKNITLYAKWAAIFNYNVINLGSPTPALDGDQRSPGISSAVITGLTDRGRQLSSVNIPDSIDGYTISSIGANAFQDCSNLTEVTIPNSVTNIGDNAFNGCTNLSEITMQSTTPPAVGTDAFAGCILLAVSVPQSAASAYNSSPSWSTVVILAPGTFSVVYNGNGSDGGIVPARQVGMTGITIQVYGNNGSLTRAGCSFNGWNTKADGTGNRFVEDGSYAGPENMTLYAQWTHPDYTVTFDDQEADIQQVSPSTMKVTAPANTIGSLPSEPRRYGYEFGGWYTEPDGAGELFVIGSSVLSSKTVYANWISLYHKVLFNSITGGTVTADKTNNILPGETVTLTINPDQGNELYSLGAKYRNTYSINISGVTYKRTFIMPSADVWITASFIPLEYTNLANLETGDIVFANGKYAKYSIFCENADIYLKCSQPIGIVAFKGGTNIFYYNETGNYQSAAAGENGKVYMLGLQESRPSFCWAPSGSTGYNKKFSTSISNGSGNWAVIQSADSYGANNASTKYPAFDYANNYSMSGFVDGWYLPAMAEVAALYRNSVYTKINNTIDSITRAGGGTFVKLPVGDTPIWSSSQVVTLNSGYESKAWCINPNATRKEYNNPKDNRFIVLVIRALN